MNDKKRKTLEKYAKISTPEELFIDTMEKIEDILNGHDEINDRIDNALIYIDEALPKFKEDMLKILKKMIPEVKDGKTPTKKELAAIMKTMIPDPVPGKPGEPGTKISAKEVVKKIKSLKEDDRLSIFDLKDMEFIQALRKHQIQWSAANGGVNNNTGGGGFQHQQVFTGSGTAYTLSSAPTGLTQLTVDGVSQTPGVDYTVTGNVLTTTTSWSGNVLVATY